MKTIYIVIMGILAVASLFNISEVNAQGNETLVTTTVLPTLPSLLSFVPEDLRGELERIAEPRKKLLSNKVELKNRIILTSINENTADFLYVTYDLSGTEKGFTLAIRRMFWQKIESYTSSSFTLRMEAGIKRHQTKIKRCQTLIKKNNRKISALKRFL
ncbi:hypothetical protein LCGC14_3157600 [marine sediment metagenome]|uniref:Uncharacterized protein n=1 Tax=marine sediment metagenome TaxID=412755 RepID=A0A0F8XYZ8_9ZZZZ